MPGEKLRPGVELFLHKIEECLNKNKGYIFHVFLPTGYGKSEASLHIMKLLAKGFSSRNDLSVERVIHVIPTKYLVEDLVRRARQKRFPAMAQSMFMDPLLKAPYFIQPLIFTTLDSFVLNYYRVPVAEVETIVSGRSLGHSEIPRYSIMTSINIFDEYHLFIPGDSPSRDPRFESKAWTTLYLIIRDLTELSVPIVLETATPRYDVLNQLKTDALIKEKTYFVEIAYDYTREEETRERIIVRDKDFANFSLSKRIVTRKPVKKNLINILNETYQNHGDDHILVVVNTVRDAINIFSKVKDKFNKCLILHSRLTIGDRKKRIEEIVHLLEKGRPFTLISTQVVEVGVNLDFRILITSASPIASLVQRIGRIGRGIYLKDVEEFEVNIVYNTLKLKDSLYDGVYLAEVVRRTMESINNILERDMEISWKIPSSKSFKYDGIKFIPYNLLVKNIYGETGLRLDGNLKGVLKFLMEPHFESRKIYDYIVRLGGLIRDSMILPVYIPEEVVIKEERVEFKIDNLVPVKASLLGIYYGERDKLSLKRIAKTLMVNDDNIMCILSDLSGDTWYKYVSVKDLKKLLIKMHTYIDGKLFSLEALVARPEKYDREVGLKIDI